MSAKLTIQISDRELLELVIAKLTDEGHQLERSDLEIQVWSNEHSDWRGYVGAMRVALRGDYDV